MEEHVTYHGVLRPSVSVDLTLDDDATCLVCDAPAIACLPVMGPEDRLGSAVVLCAPCVVLVQEGDADRLSTRLSEPADEPEFTARLIAALALASPSD